MECALVKYDLEQAPLSDLQMQPIEEAIRFESEIYHTKIYTRNGPEDLTCSQGYVVLTGAFGTMFSEPQVEEALNLAVRSTADLAGTATGGFDWTDKLNNSSAELFAGLGGAGIAAQQMALTMIVEPVLMEAAQGKYDSFQDESLAISMTNAIEQRNISWATQRSFFQETIYPMMTFFEGLSFAITPFIAFLMVMGAFGIKLGIKYFMLLIWIQLWLPLMSIVDLFITEGAAAEIAMAGSATGAGANSIYFMNAAYDAAKTWIGTGSYMATAVPMIAMFLVSGSMYGAASLASSISQNTAKGADAAAEAVQPDAMSVGALNSASAGSGSQFGLGGAATSGREGEIGSINLGSAASASTRAAEQNMRSETDSFGAQFSQNLANSESTGFQAKAAQSYGRAASASNSEIYTAAQKEVMGMSDSYNASAETSSALSGILAGAISGQLSTPAAKAAAGAAISADGRIQQLDKDEFKQAFSEKLENADSSEFTEQQKSEFGTSTAAQYQYAQDETYGSDQRHTEAAGLTQASQQVESASESYENAQAFEQRFGHGREFDARAVANNMDDNEFKGLRDKLDEQNISTVDREQDYGQVVGQEHAAKLAVLDAALESDDAETRAMARSAVMGVTHGPDVDQGDIGTQQTGGVNTDNVDTSEIASGAGGLSTVGTTPTIDPNARPSFEAMVAADGYDNALNVMEQNAANQFELASDAQGPLMDQINNYGKDSRDSFSAYSLTGMDDTGGSQVDSILAATRAGDDAFIALGGNLADTTSEAADGFTTGTQQAYQAAQETEGSTLDKMGAFFSNLGESYGETASGLMSGVGESFSGGIEAGMNSYESQRQDIADAISQDVQEQYGLNEVQGNLFAESQMNYLDQAMGLSYGGENYQEARAELVDAYSGEYGGEFANNMANTILMASANTDYAGGQLSTISAFNITDEAQETSRAMQEQIGGASGGTFTYSGGSGGGGSPYTPEFMETMNEMNEKMEEVSMSLEQMGISFTDGR